MAKIQKNNTKKEAKQSSKKTQKKSIEITKDMTIGEILEICPESALFMAKYGLHCIGCAISTMESLEDGCKSHMLTDEEVDTLVKEINEQIKN